MENPRVLRYVVEIARRLRRNQTSAEEILWACLRNRRPIGAKFRRQHPLKPSQNQGWVVRQAHHERD
jgi:very-short-patch-repair endonuclease